MLFRILAKFHFKLYINLSKKTPMRDLSVIRQKSLTEQTKRTPVR